jgi:hypothetical protein
VYNAASGALEEIDVVEKMIKWWRDEQNWQN